MFVRLVRCWFGFRFNFRGQLIFILHIRPLTKTSKWVEFFRHDSGSVFQEHMNRRIEKGKNGRMEEFLEGMRV